MRVQIILYLIISVFILSCDNSEKEQNELALFLEENFEFNNRLLNTYKAEYYQVSADQPSRKINRLEQLDETFEELMSDIDKAISNGTGKTDSIKSKTAKIKKELPLLVDNRQDYLLTNIQQPNVFKTELELRYLKNRLVISMAYAFEYASRKTVWVDGFYKIEVDSIITQKTKDGIKLTLTSEFGQAIDDDRHVVIKSIKLNGQPQDIDYKLKSNYSFADIDFPRLLNGTYEVKGALRFYGREGQIDIPFQKIFEVE